MSMTQEPTKALELFYSYAHTDERWRKRLEIHLSNLQRQGFIVAWHDRNISAGTTWANEIDAHLNTAQIILLLISPDFIASDYCYSIEMKRAMERHQAGEARVIPVILRPTDWEGTPFKQLQALPSNARPLSRWQNRDGALLDVVNGIREAVKELLASTSVPLMPRSSIQETVSSKIVLPAALASSTTDEKRPDITAISLKPEPIWKVPTTFTPLVGRDQDVSTACALLTRPEVRLLTLLGAGGIGKTRLAIHIATEVRDAFPDGVCFVPLAPISDPTLVIPTIAHELDIQETGAQPIFEHLKTSLLDRHILLILDNFEQIVTARSQVEELLAACQTVKMLMTSRVVLGIQGEQEFQVPPLALPDLTHLPEHEMLSHYAAITLFLQRARAVLSSFELTQDNARAIAEICARLDGLPLAIELAAARIRVLPPQALLARLSQRMQVLTGGARTAPARQQTLRNTIAWSYNLLAEQEQRLFRQLSVFVGGCSLAAAEAVCSSSSNSNAALSVLDGVSSLVEQSLLQQTEQKGGEPRYMMLETIREYGLEALEASGEEEATRHAHASYFLALAEDEQIGPQRIMWLDRLERNLDNVRAAMQWSIVQAETRKDEQSLELALRLGGELGYFWVVRGHVSEGRNFLERVLTLGQGGTVGPARANALQRAGILAAEQHDIDRARVLLEESLLLFREFNDARNSAYTLRKLAGFANYKEARMLLEEAMAFSREVNDMQGIASAREILGWKALSQGDYTSAHSIAEECLEAFKALDDRRSIAGSLKLLGETIFFQGDDESASILLEESLARFREVDDKSSIADTLYHLGQVVLHRGDVATAHALAEDSLGIHKEIESPSGQSRSLALLAKVALRQGDYPAAHTLYEQSLAIAKEARDEEAIVACLDGLANVVLVEGEPAWAARLWGATETLGDTRGRFLPPVERVPYEQAVAAARAQLGEKDFAIAWADGRAMTPEQALAAKNYTA
jgi:predicted ATPase